MGIRSEGRIRDHGETATMSVARMQNGSDGNGASRGTAVITRTKTKTKPSLYRVLILKRRLYPDGIRGSRAGAIFSRRTAEAATRIMLHVHNHTA